MKKKLAISIGDLNGIGLEIALRSHENVKQLCEPIYCINECMLSWGAALLEIDIPTDFAIAPCGEVFEIYPGACRRDAGKASFASFAKAIELAQNANVDGIVTLPINKEAWAKAGVEYKGHTDALSEMLGCEAIMMLGCEQMFVLLFTHHIAHKDVSEKIKTKKLTDFLLTISKALQIDKIGVLGLNPHAGDNGVIGSEEKKITKAIVKANAILKAEVFVGPLVPDTTFSPANRDRFTHYVCMYHDQGLIPLKTLYFEESINVSLNAGIIRTSVDHGTAFDIAYKNKNPSNISYLNAIKEAIKLIPKSI